MIFRLVGRMGIIVTVCFLGMIGLARLLAPIMPSEGILVYVSSIYFDRQIFTTDLSRHITHYLHPSNADEFRPSISPLTRDLVFVSMEGAHMDLYWLSADGRESRQLTDNHFVDLYPQWSPDGKSILFQANSNGQAQFYRVNPDSGEIMLLVSLASPIARPSWSLDGKQIAYDAASDIFIYDLATETSRQITRNSTWAQSPAWSPDGTQLVYEAYEDGSWNLFRINIDSFAPIRLTQHNRDDRNAIWSPDGENILFQSTRQYPARFYRIPANGRREQVTEVFIPSSSSASIYSLFLNFDASEPQWTDLMEADWIP